MAKTLPIGIDLGTTNSCVAVYRKGRPEVIANDQGNYITPSIVTFNNAELLIGDTAKTEMSTNPSNTVCQAKRLIGREFNDPTVQEDKKHLPFKIVSEDGKLKIQIQNEGEIKTFFPEEISAMVLAKMKETAEAYLGTRVEKAVITIPAYFNNAQRAATIDAAKIARLKVMRIINEPTASGLAYGLDKKMTNDPEHKILVFDLGGGTFDVSILTVNGSVFTVNTTSGDSHLGGEDFDNCLVEHCIKDFERRTKIDRKRIKEGKMVTLRQECELAKRQLSGAYTARINIGNLCDQEDYITTISRAKFEDLCAELFLKIIPHVEEALLDAEMDKSDIDEILLVGGSTRLPQIQELIQDYFPGKQLSKGINFDEAVAHGAAILAAIIDGDPSEELEDLRLLDVTPLSLGVETDGQDMSTVVKRNTNIPVTKTRNYTTTRDNQEELRIKVFEGERALTANNNFRGEFYITRIPPAPRRTPSINITFDINDNGILKVSAVDNKSGQKNNMTITNNRGRHSTEEIYRMVREAELYKNKDQAHRDRAKVRNDLESYALDMRKLVQDKKYKFKITEDEKNKIASRCDQVIEWLDSNKVLEKDRLVTQIGFLNNICKPVLRSLNVPYRLPSDVV